MQPKSSFFSVKGRGVPSIFPPTFPSFALSRFGATTLTAFLSLSFVLFFSVIVFTTVNAPTPDNCW